MFDVFGTEMPLAVRFFMAFLIVLGLIGAAAWAVRRFGSARIGGAVRGRQPRLGVIDYASVDARRRLILVRRDNVEHLLMIGGPTDVVVESNIVRAVPATREPVIPRGTATTEPLSRPMPLPEAASNGSWPLQPEPPAVPSRRPPRIEPPFEEPSNAPTASEEATRSQHDMPNAPADDLAVHAPSPPSPAIPATATPPRPRPATLRPQRTEQRPAPAAPPASIEPTPADQSLAEMAQRLEEALRRPKATATQVSEHPGETEAAAPPPPPPRVARPTEPRPIARPEAKAKESAKEGAKEKLYDTLEQEMASLLGRPTGKI
jgi:flagellar biogenesis protein FliO